MSDYPPGYREPQDDEGYPCECCDKTVIGREPEYCCNGQKCWTPELSESHYLAARVVFDKHMQDIWEASQ